MLVSTLQFQTAEPPAGVLLRLAMQHYHQGRIEEARQLAGQTLALDPCNAEALNLLGLWASAAGEFDAAIGFLRQAIAQAPGQPLSRENLGHVFFRAKRWSEAIEHGRQSLNVLPKGEQAETWNALGCCLEKTGELSEAVACFHKALTLVPNAAGVLVNLGCALEALGDVEPAITCFRQALAALPSCAPAHYHLALMLLLTGNYREGLLEWGWRPARPRVERLPEWRGEDLDGQHLLVVAEQGFGDVLQFVRFLRTLQNRGGRPVLAAQAALQSLLRASFPECTVSDTADGHPECAFYVSLLSLPGYFSTTVETIPAEVPYLRPDPERVKAWRAKLEQSDTLRVGVAWSGNAGHCNDDRRSLPLSTLAPLFDLPGISWHSLQVGRGAEQAVGTAVQDHAPELHDFAETAALVENLDLILTVDTAVAHLSGAMGKKVWVMLPAAPDWRWMLERKDSPWYPTMTLFRQSERGNWGAVVQEVRNALARL